jgi:hypothetical protein
LKTTVNDTLLFVLRFSSVSLHIISVHCLEEFSDSLESHSFLRGRYTLQIVKDYLLRFLQIIRYYDSEPDKQTDERGQRAGYADRFPDGHEHQLQTTNGDDCRNANVRRRPVLTKR